MPEGSEQHADRQVRSIAYACAYKILFKNVEKGLTMFLVSRMLGRGNYLERNVYRTTGTSMCEYLVEELESIKTIGNIYVCIYVNFLQKMCNQLIAE